MIALDATALGLLAAAGADPDDDGPRLVFADWLEEHGGDDERAWAELIRLQIGRAKLVPLSEAWKALSERDEELARILKERLVRPLPGVPGMIIEFSRGLLRLSAHARYFFEHEQTMRDWLREAGPGIVSLYLRSVPVGKTECLTDSFQQGLPPINLFFNSGAARDRGLAHAARLGRLVELAALSSHVTDKGLAHLRGHRQLRSLSIEAPRVTDRGAEAVAAVPGLRHVGLTDSQVTDDGLDLLAGLTELRSLSLSGSKVTDRGVAHLARMPRLERLKLSSTAITDRGLEVISRLPALQWLTLDDTAVTDAGVACLRERLTLTILKVDKTSVTPAAKAAVRAALPDLFVY